MEPRPLLTALFEAALDAADPAQCVPPHLPPRPAGRTVVVGAGKAAAAMALAVENAWLVADEGGDLSGLVVTRYGHGAPCRRIEVVEAAHPVPDAAGRAAAGRMLDMVGGLGADDLMLCLMSGGASALLALPARGLTLEDKQAVNRDLLRCGADITEMNTVRKHLSAIKGGRLAAAAAPARVLTLAISDVPGDDPAVIGSGPTVGDPTSAADALAVLKKYGLDRPGPVTDHLAAARDESPFPDDARLAGAETLIIARPADALAAAARLAESRGVPAHILGDAIEGDATAVARDHAALARRVRESGQPLAPPCVLLSGGETTVTVRGGGRGGRNAEFLLALAVALDGMPGVHALAADTDGIDGSEDNAGAVLAPDSLARAAALGVDGADRLADNDGYGFFQAVGDLLTTGPTRTNVNDFRAVLVLPVSK